MPEPSIRMTKIWEDVDFYEIRMEFEGNYCSVLIDFYTTNEDLEEFRQGIENFSNLNMTEFKWTSGNDIENVTHFLSLRFFKHNDRGHIGIEIIADNKMEKPYHMRSNFFIITELNQLDDFVKKLKSLINEEIIELESIIPTN
ncbi:hypothetical protein KUV80_03910 [Fictibacillus nanhaiensis]|uniref:hypothetical protein n=1 Tax=Fictibacillus nanhaiensis TaxID=742169 RepID=UPI001C94D110|nr:hypothetical protein [Fictibacillus nanhaiensis]MBY6035779.1 hypothetical protein [Fictibacillus nanhaiensis]